MLLAPSRIFKITLRRFDESPPDVPEFYITAGTMDATERILSAWESGTGDVLGYMVCLSGVVSTPIFLFAKDGFGHQHEITFVGDTWTPNNYPTNRRIQ